MTSTLAEGRACFDSKSWSEAYEKLTAAEAESPLEPADLERVGTAARLIGKEEIGDGYFAHAHQLWAELGESERAARCAFWLGMGLMQRGETAQGGGWLGRAGQALAGVDNECAVHGLLLVPVGLQAMMGGDAATALDTFTRALEIGSRTKDADVLAFGRLGLGQSLIRLDRVAEGVASLDEAMVSVIAEEPSPVVAGIVYCAVVEACQEIFDLRRAHEWTEALNHWCQSQPDLAPFRGQCLVHRSEIMQLRGAWIDAMSEAESARARLSEPPTPAVGLAYYQQGELHRLRGEFDEAERSFREANRHGRKPDPGLALLRLAQGQSDPAATMIRRVLDAAPDRVERSRALAAYVEIMIAVDDVASARTGAAELMEVAGALDVPLMHAIAAHAEGSVLLAGGDPRGALESLDRAWRIWHTLEAPYEEARTRLLVGLAYRDLGDEDAAELESDAARKTFDDLGAKPDLDRMDRLIALTDRAAPGGLTGREAQVLALVATGKTNREIAADLVISEKTVARHISNIFTKLGLSSRAAATAYAYEHDLV